MLPRGKFLFANSAFYRIFERFMKFILYLQYPRYICGKIGNSQDFKYSNRIDRMCFFLTIPIGRCLAVAPYN